MVFTRSQKTTRQQRELLLLSVEHRCTYIHSWKPSHPTPTPYNVISDVPPRKNANTTNTSCEHSTSSSNACLSTSTSTTKQHVSELNVLLTTGKSKRCTAKLINTIACASPKYILPQLAFIVGRCHVPPTTVNRVHKKIKPRVSHALLPAPSLFDLAHHLGRILGVRIQLSWSRPRSSLLVMHGTPEGSKKGNGSLLSGNQSLVTSILLDRLSKYFILVPFRLQAY